MADNSQTTGAGDALALRIEGVRITLEDGVLAVLLDRAEKKNALNAPMCEGLTRLLGAASDDERVGAVVVAGAGGVFSAGADISLFAGGLTEATAAPLGVLRALHRSAAPVVASVEGDAIGVGATLLLHCDFVYAAPSARLHTPFIDLALCPEGASSLLMPQRLGRGRANAMLMLGEALDAEAAEAGGLVDAIHAAPLETAMETARRLAAKPRAAMRATKRLLREAQDAAIEATLTREAELFADRLRSSEAQAAFMAFLARKREASASGRA